MLHTSLRKVLRAVESQYGAPLPNFVLEACLLSPVRRPLLRTTFSMTSWTSSIWDTGRKLRPCCVIWHDTGILADIPLLIHLLRAFAAADAVQISGAPDEQKERSTHASEQEKHRKAAGLVSSKR